MRRIAFQVILVLIVASAAGVGSAGVIEIEGSASMFIVPPLQATIKGGPPGGPYAAGPFSGNESLTLQFLACCTADPLGGALTFAWDLDYDQGFGFVVDATGPGPVTHTDPDGPATHVVALRVTSTSGAVELFTETITIANVAPTANAGGPYTGAMGTPVTFAGFATDPSPTDVAAGLTYQWDPQYTGTFVVNCCMVGPSPSFTYASAGNFTVALRVLDKDGGTSPISTSPVTISGSLTAVAMGDSYIRENSTGSNFGTTTTMFVRSEGGGNDRRALVQFDVSSIPSNATITAATLSLYANAVPSASRTHQVFRVTSTWTETGVTWGTQPTLAATPTSAAATPGAAATMTWDVKADVQAWVNGTATNFGSLVRDLTEGSGTPYEASYNTRESGTPSLRPTLTVTYTVP